MLLDQTDFGPVFSSREKLIEWYSDITERSVEEAEKALNVDYPCIEIITLDDTTYHHDR
jgi:hypothetical protein